MLPRAQKLVYDPLPPYDVNDVESNRQQDSNGDDHINPLSNETAIQTKCTCGRYDKISHRSCCRIAFAYFVISVIAIILVVLIIAHYNYLTRTNSH
jgi:hypothetical protein